MIRDNSIIESVERISPEDSHKSRRNPLFLFDNEKRLLWYNHEFTCFINEFVQSDSIESGIEKIRDMLNSNNAFSIDEEQYSSFISEAGYPSGKFYIHSHPLHLFSDKTLFIGQISAEPCDIPVDKRDRDYNITTVINQLGRNLSKSYRPEETFKIILIGATAGEGLGFNRAFLLLYDNDNDIFRGEMAIGPSDGKEAAAIWSELDGAQKTLDELIDNYNNATSKYDVKVNELVRLINIRKENLCSPFKEVIESQKPIIVKKSNCQSITDCGASLFDILSVDSIAVAPLTVEGNIMGLLLADNFITGRAVTEADLEILGIFANHAGAAVERSRLYEKLGEKIELLAHANEMIRDGQKKLIESEKLTAIGKMASQVAHEIRNPLSVVGGYARSIRRKRIDERNINESLDIIIKEVDRIEEVLENFTSVAKAAPEVNAVLDFTELVREVLQIQENGAQFAKPVFNIDEFAEGINVYGSEKQLRNALLAVSKQYVKNSPDTQSISVTLKVTGDLATLAFICESDVAEQSHAGRVFTNIFHTSPLKRETDLVIANEIINRHTGTIGVQHGKDQPLSLFINLPIYKE